MGRLTAAAITCGAMEGVALAVGIDGAVFSLGAMAGYLLLTVWLIWSGVSMVLEGRQLLRTTHLAPEQM